jgi:phosphate transport system protein
MFDNLIKFWKGDDYLSKVLSEFQQMLVDSQNIFNSVFKFLVENEETPGLEDKVFGLDKKVNQLERDIRTRIITHLSLRPEVDTSMSLLLMSVIKDAERLGDYGKNLFGVSQILAKPIEKAKYHSYFGDIDKDIINLFEDTKNAFMDNDEGKAAKTWKYEDKIVKFCDNVIDKLAKSDDLSTNEAVSYTLIARYYKRIAAHLANIATSVILPLNDLDFYDEKHKPLK